MTVRLPEEDYEALRALAFYTGTTMVALIRQGVRHVLTTHDDIDAAIEEASNRFRARLDGLR